MSQIGPRWKFTSWTIPSWYHDSWGTILVPSGGTRLPNSYESLEPRLERARKIRRKLLEERKRLALLKKQQAKVEVRYQAITLTNNPPLLSPDLSQPDKAELLALELKELTQRVALQAETVRRARKEADRARREAEDRNETELAMEAHRALEAQSEWERLENERLEQEADDEMQAVLLLIHEDL